MKCMFKARVCVKLKKCLRPSPAVVVCFPCSRYVPTMDDVEMYKSHKGPVTELHIVDQYMLEVQFTTSQ